MGGAPPSRDEGALSPVRQQRRERLLTAAEGLFARLGFRATTMEQVAEAAGIAKVTVYSYFPDKEAIFVAVGDAVAQRILDSVRAALVVPGPVAERVAAGLVAKHRIVFDLMRVSPFSAEIFAAKDTIFGDRALRLDDAVRSALATCIGPRTCARATPDVCAKLLFAAADGIATHGESFPRIAADITLVCATILGPD